MPIVDYSQQIEFSSDMRLNYTMHMEGDGVNHLICLGQGELKNRIVRHLYVDQNGNIGSTQYYTGVDEIAAVDGVPRAVAEAVYAGIHALD